MAAAESGADAVKFQTYRVDRLLIPSRERYGQQAEGAESAYQRLRRCELGWDDQEKLKRHADERGIMFFSTPFDEESADFLDSLGVPVFKIASADITHIPLLHYIASKKKPVLLSTGMSFLSEVADAVYNLKSAGAGEILLMHCVSAYSASPQQMNLRALQTLQSYFGLPVGLSDHSKGILIPLISVAMGAVLIEKHFTLDRALPGPDHEASLTPDELRAMVSAIRNIESALGDGVKREDAMRDVETVMRIRHRLKLNQANDFDVATQDMAMKFFDQATGAIYLALVVISSIALMVGGIGVMAIMMISVTERTREIGVRKALGARRREILWQFLLEAVVLTSVGGLLGVLFGAAVGVSVRTFTPLPVSMPWWSFAIGFAFSGGVGIFFGLFPAFRASCLDPIEALRYE